MPARVPIVSREAVTRLWLERQGLAAPRGSVELTPESLTRHLERTGGLQIDTVNVLERAHYLTLWSRFGVYDRRALDRWVYRDRCAYEYWGHEASVLPISHLALGRRRMRRFPPRAWRSKSWWERYNTSAASKRRVLRRIRNEGALESADFERRPSDLDLEAVGWAAAAPKEDKRSLKLLWHQGRLAVADRRHFRCVYDLAERVYPDSSVASLADYEDSWLLIGLGGNGVASESHLLNYMTAPALDAARRRRIIARNLRKKRVLRVRVGELRGPFYARPEDLEGIEAAPRARGTTLLSPFDSLLWQRRRAEELLDFEYRVEIYTPAAKRRFGYYVLPVLHDGRLVGRLDPKLHRDRAVLEIKSIHLEADFVRSEDFERGLGDAIGGLAEFVGAARVRLPRGWGRLEGGLD